jgi:hypothetical protein
MISAVRPDPRHDAIAFTTDLTYCYHPLNHVRPIGFPIVEDVELKLSFGPQDFGPFNLATLYRFRNLMEVKLGEAKGKNLVFYTSSETKAVATNSAFLLASYLVCLSCPRILCPGTELAL